MARTAGWCAPGLGRRLLAVAAMGACLLALNLYYLIVLSSALAFAIACLSLNLLFGYTGLLSLGHALYFGLGAYTGAFLFTFGDVTSCEVYLGSSVLVATMTAAVFGAACARATRGYFTILMLALGTDRALALRDRHSSSRSAFCGVS